MKASIAIILALFLLVACAPETPQATGTVKTDDNAAPTQPTQPTQPQDIAQAEPDTNAGDPAVLKLFDRNSQVKSYKFDLARLPDRRGSHTYYVRGSKVFVDPIIDQGYSDTEMVEQIYLDLDQKTAIGYCVESRGCNPKDAPIELEFADYEIVYPHEWIDQVKYGTKVTTLTFENKPVTVVRYEVDGKYYEAYVDNYFGYPVRIAIASDAEMENIIDGYEYRAMAFNTVKDADVVFTPEN